VGNHHGCGMRSEGRRTDQQRAGQHGEKGLACGTRRGRGGRLQQHHGGEDRTPPQGMARCLGQRKPRNNALDTNRWWAREREQPPGGKIGSRPDEGRYAVAGGLPIGGLRVSRASTNGDTPDSQGQEEELRGERKRPCGGNCATAGHCRMAGPARAPCGALVAARQCGAAEREGHSKRGLLQQPSRGREGRSRVEPLCGRRAEDRSGVGGHGSLVGGGLESAPVNISTNRVCDPPTRGQSPRVLRHGFASGKED